MSDQRPLRPLRRAIGLFAIGAVGLAACGGGDDTSAAAGVEAPQVDTSVVDTAGPATPFGLVAPETALDLAGRSDVTVIDVRTPEEFAEGHIEGATMIDFYTDTFADEIAGLDPDGTYLLYCRSGNRSGQTATLMDQLGFEQVYDLDGGVNAFSAQGLPLVP